MKVAFWSPFHGTGATANLLALSVAISELMDKKVLVTQTHYNMNNLEGPLLGEVEDGEQFFRDTGLDAIMRFYKSGALTEEQVDNCSIKVSKNLYLLAGTKASSRESYENRVVQDMVTHIITLIENYYDVVFVDTNSGDNEQSLKVISECDMVIVTMRQNRDMIESVLKDEKLKGKKIYYLFGSYDPYSKYTLKNLRKLYKELTKENSGGLPHCTQYMDALADNKILKYIHSNLDADEDYADYDFFEALRETAADIAELAVKKIK